MIAWLWNLIVGRLCNHRWEVVGHCVRVNKRDVKTGDDLYLRCTKRGDMKCRSL
jgi:hypothetical protein